MTPEKIKSTIRQLNEAAWHRRDLNECYQAYADEFVFHRAPFPAVVGKEANMQLDEGMLSAFTETQITINELVVEDATAVAYWTWRAKHTGLSPTLAIPPTGKQVQFSGCSIYHFREDKIVEQWEYSDMLGLLQQVELIPALG